MALVALSLGLGCGRSLERRAGASLAGTAEGGSGASTEAAAGPLATSPPARGGAVDGAQVGASAASAREVARGARATPSVSAAPSGTLATDVAARERAAHEERYARARALAAKAPPLASRPGRAWPARPRRPLVGGARGACASPLPGWSWQRLDRARGLDVDLVVLTFDVGENLDNLSKLLDLLRARELPSTLFLATKSLESEQGRALVRRMHDEGHELASHTRTHRDLTKLAPAERERELTLVTSFVEGVTGAPMAPFLREPYLAFDRETDRLAAELCLRPVWFSVPTGDWRSDATAASIVSRALFDEAGRLRRDLRGAIVPLHGSVAHNLEAVPVLEGALRAMGYDFATLGDALSRAAGAADRAHGASGSGEAGP